MPLRPLGKPSVIFEGTRIKVINNEGVLPPQMTPVGGRLSNFVEGWKHITNHPYVLSIVAKRYRLCFTSPPLLHQTPWEIRSPQGPEEILGMRDKSPSCSKRTEVPLNSPGFYSNIFLVRKGGIRRVASSYRFKESECPYPCTSFPYVHYKLSSKLLSKKRLHVQNRSAGSVLSRTYPS